MFKNKLFKLFVIYLSVILLIFLFRFIAANYVMTFAAAAFLTGPYIFGNGLKLKLKARNIIFSIVATVIIIGIYLLLFTIFTNKPINYSVLSFTLVFTHLIAISLPEEAFFRGFLQEELGNSIKSIVIVSILFAFAHLLTICAYSGHFGLHCVSALLTFFPSLVMGFLYYKNRSIWGSVLFHFLANIAYISTSGYSVFY